MSKYQKMEPPYRRVSFFNETYEAKGLKILFKMGIPFNYVGAGFYIVTSDQCHVLTENDVKYKKFKNLNPRLN